MTGHVCADPPRADCWRGETIANGGLADAEARLGFSNHRIVAAHTQATHHTIPQATLHLIIEVTSAHDAVPGLHGKVTVEGGSFADVNGSIDLQYQLGMNTSDPTGLSTNRYLDPTVQQNYTNHGSGAGVGGSWERNWGSSDRSRIEVRHDHVGFMVPNESLQQDAGQRQDRTSDETCGQISFTHVFSPSVLLDLRGSGRDLAATLWSTVLSTPIEPFSESQLPRGLRVGRRVGRRLGASRHSRFQIWRGRPRPVHHRTILLPDSAYQINGAPIFDPDNPPSLFFADRRQDREQAAYVQDQIRSLTSSPITLVNPRHGNGKARAA